MHMKGYLIEVFKTFDEYLDTVLGCSWPTFLFIITLLFLSLNPFNIFLKTLRKEVMISLKNLILAPFMVVRFRDFFLGDILTSLVKPFLDIMFMTCYFDIAINSGQSKHFKEQTFDCSTSSLTSIIVSILPLWFRFW